MCTDKVFSLPTVPLVDSDAILKDTLLGMADAGYAMEQVAREFAYFQQLDLYVERKRHVRTERWLQVCNMCLAATVQKLSLWNCKQPDLCQPATVSLTLAGMPEVIDIFALAPWHLLRSDL